MRIKNVREAINDWGLLHDQKKKKEKKNQHQRSNISR